MKKDILNAELADKITDLYRRMEKAYDQVAKALNFSCRGCPDNCCDSFFMHHTLIEWAYLWQGLATLDPEAMTRIRAKAERYLAGAADAIARDERPQIICPLNDRGLCSLYSYRLMICRMHGVPSSSTRPDGHRQSFPGCFRCQELTADRQSIPEVDRTDLYRELADLEQQLRSASRYKGPRIKMTIAEMIMVGPPKI